MATKLSPSPHSPFATLLCESIDEIQAHNKTESVRKVTIEISFRLSIEKYFSGSGINLQSLEDVKSFHLLTLKDRDVKKLDEEDYKDFDTRMYKSYLCEDLLNHSVKRILILNVVGKAMGRDKALDEMESKRRLLVETECKALIESRNFSEYDTDGSREIELPKSIDCLMEREKDGPIAIFAKELLDRLIDPLENGDEVVEASAAAAEASRKRRYASSEVESLAEEREASAASAAPAAAAPGKRQHT